MGIISGAVQLGFAILRQMRTLTIPQATQARQIGEANTMQRLYGAEILHYIYNALVQPHFDYCSIVWGNCGKTLSERLQKLQNRAARIFDFPPPMMLTLVSCYNNLGWKDLITQRQIQVALMVFKAVNDLAPDHLSSMLTEAQYDRLCLKGLYEQIECPFTEKPTT